MYVGAYRGALLSCIKVWIGKILNKGINNGHNWESKIKDLIGYNITTFS